MDTSEMNRLLEEIRKPRIAAVGQLGSKGDTTPVVLASDGRCWWLVGGQWVQRESIPLD